jgi:hypothetical protein
MPKHIEAQLQSAKSIEEIKQVYDDGPPLPVTKTITADNTRGRNRKTLVSCSCDGPDGYIGTIVVAGELNPGQTATIDITARGWTVVRYQFNYFEWTGRSDDPQPGSLPNPPRAASPGKYFPNVGVRWVSASPQPMGLISDIADSAGDYEWLTTSDICASCQSSSELVLDISNFTFDADITASQRQKLIDCHTVAFGRIDACPRLNAAQKQALKGAYSRSIRHSATTKPGVNAYTYLNGSQIWVNFGVLFPQGDREISQTLIHEMMHCAGYTHPQRTANDRPYDNGPYYSTPPLQAEICIAGQQSDERLLAFAECSECIPSDDGAFTHSTGAIIEDQA